MLENKLRFALVVVVVVAVAGCHRGSDATRDDAANASAATKKTPDTRIAVDPKRLQAIGLSGDEVVTKLRAAGVDVVEAHDGTFSGQPALLVMVAAGARDPSALAKLELLQIQGAPVRVSDIAIVERLPPQ